MEGKISKESFKLYVGKVSTMHISLKSAMEAANKHIARESYLRIEAINGEEAGNWWAYEHENKKWSRS